MFYDFRAKRNAFAPERNPEMWDPAELSRPPHLWWESHAQEAPELRSVAMRVLSLVSSSGASERNWSSWLHPLKEAQPPHRTACKQAGVVFSDLRLLNTRARAGGAARQQADSESDAEPGPDEETYWQ